MAIALAQAIPTKVFLNNESSKTLAFGSACTNGSRIVVALTYESRTVTISSVSDGTNTYAADKEVVGAVGAPAESSAHIWSAPNTSTSALTVTVTLSAPVYGYLEIYELKDGGGSAAVQVDSTGGTASLDGSLTINANVTTVAANCAVIVVVNEYNNTTYAADSGYTSLYRTAGSNNYHAQEYNLDVGAAGAKTIAMGSSSNVAYYSAASVAYKLAASATVLNSRKLLLGVG